MATEKAPQHIDMLNNPWYGYEVSEEEFQMRIATAPHHTNPRSATLDFWRKTLIKDDYGKIQAKRRTQMNIPTSSNIDKQEHMIIAHRMAEMEKRRIGTRFLDREVTEMDMEKPLMEKMKENCKVM